MIYLYKDLNFGRFVSAYQMRDAEEEEAVEW